MAQALILTPLYLQNVLYYVKVPFVGLEGNMATTETGDSFAGLAATFPLIQSAIVGIYETKPRSGTVGVSSV